MTLQDPLVGAEVDHRYTIRARVARGGMATVYRAHDSKLDRSVAVKLMHPHLSEQPQFVERFHKEALAAARISDPHAVSVFDQGVWDTPRGQQAYLVMELITGPDLRTELLRLGSLRLADALSVTEQVLSALAAAHNAGIIHRDIKPENVMLMQPIRPHEDPSDGQIVAKVTDFGLARAVSGATTSSLGMGTVGYVAPEIITQGRALPASDVYSTGIMLYELLSGRLPFEGETPISTAYMHVNAPMKRLTELADWIPDALDSLIGYFTAKNPEDRPTDAGAALSVLRRSLRSLTPSILAHRIPTDPRATTANTASAPTQRTQQESLSGISDADPHHDDHAPTSENNAKDGSSAAADPRAAVNPRSDDAQANTLSATQLMNKAHADAHHAQLRAQLGITDGQDRRETRVHRSALRSTSKAASTRSSHKRHAVIFICLFLLVLGVAGSLAWYFLAGPGKAVTVPHVNGQAYTQALSTLADAHLNATKSESYSDTVAQGIVISSTPEEGSRARVNSRITLTVSKGIERVSVPDFSGLSEDDALAAAKKAKLTPIIEREYSEDVSEGLVAKQSSEAGTSLDHDSNIVVTISKGREPLPIPDLTGKSQSEAEAAATQAGFAPHVTEDFSDSIPKGQVIEQKPTDGTGFRGDTLTLVVSKGPELARVPDVFGKQKQEALTILSDAGFKVKVNTFLGGVFGTVRSQDPAAGSMVPVGSTITITVV
ncbi:MAG: PASTA domain-containing protein [Actinomycetaceae bacterium]|nr:PASTA domain-containing protein [Actinomycetaceae bacterium]MDY6083077.1 PASTA domain-containing protein [Actinomycetaceae bacterium]